MNGRRAVPGGRGRDYSSIVAGGAGTARVSCGPFLWGLVAIQVFKTVLEMCLYLAGDWPVGLVASVFLLSLGMCLTDVPEWTICGRGGEELRWLPPFSLPLAPPGRCRWWLRL